jgi:rod shape-determining protein MreB
MLVDIGGGTTDIAVISLGGVVVSKSLRIGGDKFDEGIMRYLRRQYNLAIGEQTAENLKIRIGTCIPLEEDLRMIIKGRDLVQGLPRQIEVSSSAVNMAIGEMVQTLVDGVRNVLELTPPELSADIIDRGIVLTGGGSLLKGLTDLITQQTGINCFVAENPMECVALCTGKALSEIDRLRRSGRAGLLVNVRRGRKRRY